MFGVARIAGLALVVATVACASASAFPGGYDHGVTVLDLGENARARAASADEAGRILVAGYREATTGVPAEAFVVRLLPDGTTDTTFGEQGVVIIEGAAIAIDVAVQPDGKIVVAVPLAVVRLRPDGGLSSSFEGGGIVEEPLGPDVGLTAMTTDAIGRIVLVGRRYNPPETECWHACGSYTAVAGVLKRGGIRDPSFSGDGVFPLESRWTGIPTAVAIDADGNLLVAGFRGPASGQFANASATLIRIPPGGDTFDFSELEGDGGRRVASAVAPGPRGGAYLAGAFHPWQVPANPGEWWVAYKPPGGPFVVARANAYLGGAAALGILPDGRLMTLARGGSPRGFALGTFTGWPETEAAQRLRLDGDYVNAGDLQPLGRRRWVAVGALGPDHEHAQIVIARFFAPPPVALDTVLSYPAPRPSTGHTSARFGFGSPHPSARFRCRLDRRRWRACTSPVHYEELRSGPHRFRVRAILRDAIDATPASYRWQIR